MLVVSCIAISLSGDSPYTDEVALANDQPPVVFSVYKYREGYIRLILDKFSMTLYFEKCCQEDSAMSAALTQFKSLSFYFQTTHM